jgi:hypothetical protein
LSDPVDDVVIGINEGLGVNGHDQHSSPSQWRVLEGRVRSQQLIYHRENLLNLGKSYVLVGLTLQKEKTNKQTNTGNNMQMWIID